MDGAGFVPMRQIYDLAHLTAITELYDDQQRAILEVVG